MTTTADSTSSLAEQVSAQMDRTTLERPTPEEVMGVLDVNAKIEAYLSAAAKLWMTTKFEGAHRIELESWDEHGVQVEFYPKWVNDHAYREFQTIPMSDLLPDFAAAYQVLRALGGG